MAITVSSPFTHGFETTVIWTDVGCISTLSLITVRKSRSSDIWRRIVVFRTWKGNTNRNILVNMPPALLSINHISSSDFALFSNGLGDLRVLHATSS